MKNKSKTSRKKTYIILACTLVLIAAVAAVLLLTRKPQQPKLDYALKNENNPVATIEMRGGGTIVVELYPDTAPISVANFIELANDGFYDGVIFHRVISGFMIQGGDPTGTGSGGPGYSIKGEFAQNGVANDLKHTRGVISMARSQAYDSAGSQFFIMHADAPHLDGAYAAFGEVVYGMDTVDKIAAVSVGASDKPHTAQTIQTIRVDTRGVEYKAQKIGG